MPSPQNRIRNPTLAVISTAVVLAIGGAVGVVISGGGGGSTGTTTTGGGGTFQANLFVVPTAYSGSPAASPNCTVVRPAVTFDNAAGHICSDGTRSDVSSNRSALDNACKATNVASASVGTIVGVKAGTLARDSQGFIMGANAINCSPTAADVNPNAVEQGVSTGTTANWMRLQCADGNNSEVTWPLIPSSKNGTATIARGNMHVIFEGDCFHSRDTLNFGVGGDPTTIPQLQDVQMVGTSFGSLWLSAIEMQGVKNVLLKNVGEGLIKFCGKNDPLVPTSIWCDINGPTFEAQWANIGVTDSTCGPTNNSGCGGSFGDNSRSGGYIHGAGTGRPYSENIRLQDYWKHDQANTTSTSNGVHGHAFLTFNSPSAPANNLVFDHTVVERVTVEGWQNESGGLTIENSIVACPTSTLDQTGQKWDVCTGGNYAYSDGGGSLLSNIIIRYSAFLTQAFLIPNNPVGGYSNDRIVCNIFAQSPNEPSPGPVYANNSFLPGVAQKGSNPTPLSGNPWVDSDQTTSDHLWRTTTQLNLHLNGSVSVPSVNPSVLGADYQLDHDADGNPRGATSTHCGPYN